MANIEIWSLSFLLAMAFLAGFVDSIVGGGGLIQMPALFLAFPNLPIPSLMGTNKFAALSGTALATTRYIKEIEVPWKKLLPAFIAALVFSWIGAGLVSHFPKEGLKPMVIGLLLLVLAFTLVKKDFGKHVGIEPEGNRFLVYAVATGTTMGLYDGFFGPGTGSFLIMAFVMVFNFDLLKASASAKLVNCATNLAALSYFLYHGQVIWAIALPLAASNMIGSFIGSRLALKRGIGFVKVFFVLVVSALLIKLSWEYFGRN